MKKVVFIIVVLSILGLSIYKITSNSINQAVENSNKRAIESYAGAVKLAYVAYMYKNHIEPENMDDLNVDVAVNVKCKEKKVASFSMQDVELHGCTVEGSKKIYGYVDGKVKREN